VSLDAKIWAFMALVEGLLLIVAGAMLRFKNQQIQEARSSAENIQLTADKYAEMLREKGLTSEALANELRNAGLLTGDSLLHGK
jgi:hypothetical protein